MTDERRKALEACDGIDRAMRTLTGKSTCVETETIRQALTEPAVPAYDSEGNDLSDPTAWEQPAVPDWRDHVPSEWVRPAVPDAVRELLEEAENEVWVTCACEPKKPRWWGNADQWEMRRYEDRAKERTKRCDWHKRFDELKHS